MNGLESAVLAAEDAGVKARTYVPGYPITELASALNCEISVNEKVALEIALGASATGLRSMVVVKQVGMNILADPLVISATHTIGSGVVVIAGDDLGPRGSQAEMDSRFYGPLSELPVLDPRSPRLLHESILEAYRLSEWLRVPAIVRVTARLLSLQGPDVAARSLPAGGERFESVNWELTMRGRHQRHHDRIMAFAEEASESSVLNRLEISGDVGIIASGVPGDLALGLGVSLLSLGYSHPIPKNLLRRFIDGHRMILVAEEPEPFLESLLAESPKIKGKLTGHLPRGELQRSDIIQAIERLEKRPSKVPEVYESVADRGYPGVCEECPFRPLFYALARADAPVAGDAGCAIRATREPFSSVDVVYGLGSAAAVASGFSEKGIALMGDFALAHSGLAGLINAVWRKRDVLAIILKNDVAAMTGGQEAPDLTGLLEALLPTRRLDLPASEDEIEALIGEELKRKGACAIVARGRCMKRASVN
ncbi:MAG: thiamine pyrophosphate-dependent enzyme [Methanothrix sp.]|jgi:indolepyruvate ferredoxin oxidoreductase alpha subunit|nr:thiamine pyrophosphate-dependent enzyme [Methanothrix sp.]